MRFEASNVDPFAEPAPAKNRKMRFAILTCALGIGIVIYPGAVMDLIYILRDLGIAVWTMLCDVASACADFVDYVLQVRSG